MDTIQSPQNNPIEVYVKALIAAVNCLMQTPEVCQRDRAVMKLNRMKKYVMALQDEIAAECVECVNTLTPSDSPLSTSKQN